MKSRLSTFLVALACPFAAYNLGYHQGYKQAALHPVIVARDGADEPYRGWGKAEYSPYFSRQNPSPNQVWGKAP